LAAFRSFVRAAALASGLAICTPAEAEPLRLQVDWVKTVLLGQQWLLDGAAMEKASGDGRVVAGGGSSESPSGWIGLAPHVSVLGRDWGEAHLFVGRLATTDVFRLSRSNRMVVTRVRFGDGVVVPFGQIGVGQWRVDTDMMPGWACDMEVAAQLGAGLELRVGRVYAIALEADFTALYRDQREPQNIPYQRFWGTTAAARMHF